MDLEVFLDSDGLFRTVFSEGVAFTWRLLSLKEYKRFRSLRDAGAVHPHILHSMIFDRCLLGDPKLLHKDLPAGITISIGEAIMWLSGDCELSTIVDDIALARQHYPSDSIKEHMKRVVFTAFPSYTEEISETWTYPDLIRKFTIAESVLFSRIPGYEMTDLKKIAAPGAQKKIPGVISADEQRRDNKELRQTMGDENHPLDMHPGELARRSGGRRRELTPSAARKLDARKR